MYKVTEKERTSENKLPHHVERIVNEALKESGNRISYNEVYEKLVNDDIFKPHGVDLTVIPNRNETYLRSALNNLNSHHIKLSNGVECHDNGFTSVESRERIKQNEISFFGYYFIKLTKILPKKLTKILPKKYIYTDNETKANTRNYQAQFAENVKENAKNKCQLSNINNNGIKVCEAAHIKPVRIIMEEHNIKKNDLIPEDCYNSNNGIYLRSDLHKLLDDHNLTIHPDTLETIMSNTLKKEERYSFLEHRKLSIPDGSSPPGKKYLQYHYDKFCEKNNV